MWQTHELDIVSEVYFFRNNFTSLETVPLLPKISKIGNLTLAILQELAFFHGGNDCFVDVANVTIAEQELADYTNDWLVAWIKKPSAGPGWEKTTPISGPLAKLAVPGNEKAILHAKTGDYNARCKSVSYTFLISQLKKPKCIFRVLES